MLGATVFHSRYSRGISSGDTLKTHHDLGTIEPKYLQNPRLATEKFHHAPPCPPIKTKKKEKKSARNPTFHLFFPIETMENLSAPAGIWCWAAAWPRPPGG